MWFRPILALACSPLIAPAALADAPEPGVRVEAAHVGHLVTVGAKLGVALNAFNELSPAFAPELELGLLLPPIDQALEVFLAARWAAPSDEGVSASDARLPGDGVARWQVTRNELALGLGLRGRLALDGGWAPWAALGARLYLMSTEVSGTAADEALGAHEETGTALGFLVQLGVDYHLGPGAITGELGIDVVPLDQTILGDTNASQLDVSVGYRLFF